MIYDTFQQIAIDHIKNGHSVIVSAPTGAGKTAIAEYIIHDALLKNRKVIYTAPVKALSNQKFRDFQATFPDKIGILTGDVNINPHASVLIMTTEIFRNKILGEVRDLDDYSWIIFDEVHYIDNYERGTVWEESLIFLPSHMNILALSATIPNIDEFAGWIAATRGKPVQVVKETTRPVPLHFYFQNEGRIFSNLGEIRHYRRSRHAHQKPNRLSTLIAHLQRTNSLPCIYFAFGRKRCETLAEETREFDFLTGAEKEEIAELYRSLLDQFGISDEKSAETLRPFVEHGIAYHHAGMLPTLKEVVERMFTSRLIKIIFTTETFALGINMPARTVIFDELRKFYGKYYAALKTRDFYQMAGRAGRRGIDKEGYVYSRVNTRFTSPEELRRIIHGRHEEVKSRFNASYATILNLYDRYRENLYDIYPRSFHYYQEKIKNRTRAVASIHAKVDLLKETGFISGEKLTQKGFFASKIYGYELPLAELYSAGVLELFCEIELGVLALATVFEPRKNQSPPALSAHARRVKTATDDIIRHVYAKEKRAGIYPPSKDYFYHLSDGIEAWMKQKTFEETLALTDTDEGEIIRYFRMTIQVLREILDTDIPPHFAGKIKKAIALINHGAVDAEKQLRAA